MSNNMSNDQSMSIGEALVNYLEQEGVSVVFGIPGVHTVELYRGLASSGIRHITPRHEQGAGFMADGYARVSGKPGIAFVITGPGVTNILTPMAQSLADSVSVLVISAVNEDIYLGKGLGQLHELPDQHALCSLVSLRSEHINSSQTLLPAVQTTFDEFKNATPGPRHIQIPLDVMGQPFTDTVKTQTAEQIPVPEANDIQQAQDMLSQAQRPLLIAGGGSHFAENEITQLAEYLNAPVIQTINARGQMHHHPLKVPASPTLSSVRTFIEEADVVLAIGTQLGPTDFDMYHTGELPQFATLIRIDINPEQLARHAAEVKLCGEAKTTVAALLAGLTSTPLSQREAASKLPPPVVSEVEGQNTEREMSQSWGAGRSEQARYQALAELSADYRHMITMMETIRDALPGSIIVGDSTQPIYATNMYYDHDQPRGWFNAATGYGALGFAIPAAIGAQLAAPEQPVVCVTGDGGAQFTLPELMVAVDEKLPVIFIVWNNRGYREIETSMAAANVEVVGCDPTPPDFADIAKANFMPYVFCENNPEALRTALLTNPRSDGPIMIEIGDFES